ncbi:hypothetical protein ACO2Q9_02870 [Variovorax sp. VNK109]|uniref:hypothetical protein n=1 Tax=Variovorax sp. VNK109 TaxID=3400919 RepID=UPI003C02CD12
MLAFHETALLDALKNRPGLKLSLRHVGAIPDVPDEKLLAQYQTDAPAIYLAAPKLVVENDTAKIRAVLVIMVRNVGDRDQARKGNARELGIDQYLTLILRTVNGKFIGDTSWFCKSAEFADDNLFVKHGLTAMEVAIESGAIELPYEAPAPDMPLDDFEHFHADIDIVPHTLSAEYGKWLQQPPDYTTSRPDAQADLSLAGGS